MKTILTGIKPTGEVHLGNLFGAIKPAIDLSNKGEDQYLYFVADYHALTALRDPKKFKEQVYSIAATWIALGLDTDKAIFYKQSDIPELFEIQWMLACITPKGEMNRAHSYKARVQENLDRGQSDVDFGINMGLFSYPILMAADILTFNTNLVPVGKDQVQHVEIARSIASRVNEHFGAGTLTEPKELLDSHGGAYVPGLDGRKMSKSYDNGIFLWLPEKQLRKKIMKIVTDSSAPTDPKDPDNSLIMDLYKLFATGDEIASFSKKFKEGILWGVAKEELFNKINDFLKGPRDRYNELMENTKELDDLLLKGAQKARVIAKETLKRIRLSITGFEGN